MCCVASVDEGETVGDKRRIYNGLVKLMQLCSHSDNHTMCIQNTAPAAPLNFPCKVVHYK